MLIRDKKIWIVSELYYPVLISTGYYITEIAEYFAKSGFDTYVITSNSDYNLKKNIDFKKFEVFNNVNIYRSVSRINYDKNNFIQRIFVIFLNSFKLSKAILFKVKKTDTLLILTNPSFLPVFIWIISKIKRFKYSVLVHDLFPENLRAHGYFRKNSLIYNFIKFLFDKSYSNADKIIVIGRDMKNLLEQKVKGNKKRIKVITNWSQDKEIFPKRKEETETYQSLPENKLIIQFAGNIGKLQGIDNLLEAITLSNNRDLHFAFIGSGGKAGDIKRLIRSQGENKVSYLEFIDREQQDDFLNSCDISLVTLNKDMKGLGVPSKAYNIMAAGKPMIVVADQNSEISLCVGEEKIGWVIEPDNPKALAKLFDSIQMKDPVVKDMGKLARNCAEKRFAKKIILEKYYKTILE